MRDNTELAYLAGIIDGEGWITAVRSRQTGKYTPHVGVATTDLPLIEWIKNHFGGSVYTRTPQKGVGPRKTRYEWQIHQSMVDALLPEVLPYLVIKAERARAMIAFRNTFRYEGMITPDIRALRESTYLHLKSLNQG
jgi:hypothetical protein